MIAPSLYADLRARGVELSIARTPAKSEAAELPPLRLKVRAPEGALNETMRRAIALYRDDLLQFVFELEEAAAVLVSMYGARLEEAPELARDRVLCGRATPDGQLWLREYARLELERLGGSGKFEIVGVERLRAA